MTIIKKITLYKLPSGKVYDTEKQAEIALIDEAQAMFVQILSGTVNIGNLEGHIARQVAQVIACDVSSIQGLNIFLSRLLGTDK